MRWRSPSLSSIRDYLGIAVLQTGCNTRRCAGNFAGHKGLASARWFVVKKDSITGEHAVTFPVVVSERKGIPQPCAFTRRSWWALGALLCDRHLVDTLIEGGGITFGSPSSPFASLSRYKILRRELEGLESDKVIPDVVGISADDLQRIVRNAQSVQGCKQLLIPRERGSREPIVT